MRKREPTPTVATGPTPGQPLPFVASPASSSDWVPRTWLETLQAQLSEAHARIVELSKVVADLKRAGYAPPEPTPAAVAPPDTVLSEVVRDAIASRAADRPARQYLTDYAERRLRETQGDEDLVVKEILEGEAV